MNLKNSIENIELCKLGEFASSLSTKYKFIKYKDVIDIWNCTLGQKVTGGSTSARSVPGSQKPAAERSKRTSASPLLHNYRLTLFHPLNFSIV